jgi:hypothetical protein
VKAERSEEKKRQFLRFPVIAEGALSVPVSGTMVRYGNSNEDDNGE